MNRSETLIKRNTTHNMSRTKLYNSWRGMKERCLNPKNKEFKNYGKRSIEICKEWIKTFESFMIWSLNNGYVEGLTIDRINTNGNYTPLNCKWSTAIEQSKNRRNNTYIEYNGERLILEDWAKRVGINHSSLRSRIQSGWTIEQALTIKKGNKRNV